MRRVKKAGIDISMERMLKELDGIREVVNVYSTEGKKKKASSQVVLSKLSEVQMALAHILGLEIEKTDELGCSPVMSQTIDSEWEKAIILNN